MNSARISGNSDSQSDRLPQKTNDAPFMLLGLLGLTAGCAIGAYTFKARGKMSTSVFLMQLRMTIQGAVIVALTGGLVYQIAVNHVFNDKPKIHKQ